MRFLAAALAVAAAGCSAPPVVGVAQLAVNGAAYAVTGKTANSHGLSALTGEDCDLARSLTRDAVCRPVGQPVGGAFPGHSDREPTRSALGGVYAAATTSALLSDLGVPPYTATVPPRLFLVVASFRRADDARAVAYRLGDLPAAVAPAPDPGAPAVPRTGPYHRVVVGPFDGPLPDGLGVRLARAGIVESFPVALCAGSLTPPPCLGERRYRPRIDPARMAAADAG